MDDARYHTAKWQRLRRQIIRRDGKRCVYPGCVSDMTQRNAIHVDHVIEVDDGGSFWDSSNLQTLCKSHHLVKTGTVAASRTDPVSPNG